jgi:hypothetical protein
MICVGMGARVQIKVEDLESTWTLSNNVIQVHLEKVSPAASPLDGHIALPQRRIPRHRSTKCHGGVRWSRENLRSTPRR